MITRCVGNPKMQQAGRAGSTHAAPAADEDEQRDKEEAWLPWLLSSTRTRLAGRRGGGAALPIARQRYGSLAQPTWDEKDMKREARVAVRRVRRTNRTCRLGTSSASQDM